MRIIPVLDLKAGDVVHAVAGQRHQYAPIRSELCQGSRPGVVAAAFHELGLATTYVADLDAIAGADPDWSGLREVSGSCQRVIWDVGLRDLAHVKRCVRQIQTSDVDLVMALETLSDARLLSDAVQATDGKLIFSLDLMAGRPISSKGFFQQMSPLQIVDLAVEHGIRRAIILDLSSVGTNQGVPTTDLTASIAARHPHLELIGGGGVRGLDDLRRLHDCGCHAALVATALHQGTIGRAEIEQLSSWDARQPPR